MLLKNPDFKEFPVFFGTEEVLLVESLGAFYQRHGAERPGRSGCGALGRSLLHH